MDETLLTTKLNTPLPCQILVLRPQLTAALSKALTSSLTLVSAPTGYGKTTLVSSWLHESQIASSWISLDQGENDPVHFLQYLIAAVQKAYPAIQLEWMLSPPGMQSSSLTNRVKVIANEIARQDAAVVLVLDDFHAIQAQPVLEMVSALLEHTPPQLHLVIISRSDPPLPLARLRAHNQLVEIRAEQLRFTQNEVAVFLNQVMGLNLSASDIAALEERTEGWIAGLQLAALSLQGSQDVRSFVSAFTGSHAYIMDYLTEEVLKLQPEQVRLFLLRTSILSSMCAPLCEAVLENKPGQSLSASGAQEILEALERTNLFIVPLDRTRQWYRYHHLFADVLRLRLEHLLPGQLPELHQRASLWYEQNGIITEAIQHALLAKDMDRAARLVEEHGCSLMMSGEAFTLLKWVQAVQAYAAEHPWLAVLSAWALALTGHLDEVEPKLRAIEESFSTPLPSSDEVKIVLGSIATIRAYLADMHGEAQLAASFAQGALSYLPDSNAFSCSLRSVATSILGDASWNQGNLEQARQAYMDAAQISQAAGNVYMTIIAHSNLADVLAEQGELHRAARIYSDALQAATRSNGQKLPLADHLYQALGEIAYEWNQLEEAAGYAQQCIELSRQWGSSYVLARGYILLAHIQQALGCLEAAQEAVLAAEQIANEQRLSPVGSIWVKSSAARWWIAQGKPEKAAYWLQYAGVTLQTVLEAKDIPVSRLPEYLLLLRLLLAKDELSPAHSISERLLQVARSTHQTGLMIEILILQALSWQAEKNSDQAVATLEKALALAQPEGYIRSFLDEGAPLAKLLYQVRTLGTGQGYASELLAALLPTTLPVSGETPAVEPALGQSLIEPLTQRELEILKLIEAGCSNPEIASQLFISLPTVKRHISNIYAKLGATSRTKALSFARELGLFK